MTKKCNVWKTTWKNKQVKSKQKTRSKEGEERIPKEGAVI